jgi:hypothetical protein
LRFLHLAAGILLICGCGLSDYQEKMAAKQKVVDYWGEENQHLEGTPLKLPEKKPDDKDKEALAPDELFLRPPQGISSTPDDKALGGFLYRYASAPNRDFQDMFVAVAKNENKEKFVNEVLAQIPGAGGAPREKLVGEKAGRILRFDMRHEDLPDQTTPYVYFFYEAPYQVAIAFRPAAGARGPRVDTPIEYSLASLWVGPEAQSKHRFWRPPAPAKDTRKRRR